MMRIKHRYLLVESSVPLSRIKDFELLLSKEMMREIGEIDFYTVNPKITGVIDEKTFILRLNLEGMKKCVIALSFIKRLGDSDIAFYTLKSSGTIKALTKKG